MKNWLNRTYVITALLCFAFNLPAMADEVMTVKDKIKSVEDNTVIVSFADLDLSKQAGMNELTHRLQIAADKVCRSLKRDYRIPGTRQLFEQCYNETLAKAVESVNNNNVAMSYTVGR